ncbi:MAG: nucleotidyltransferase family protein, partial [Acidobacteria bacterium]|nr:nucleotidyltransferase family protein [Acidobacteriota bacterium]
MIRRTSPPGAPPPLEGLLAGLRLAIGAENASAQRAALLEVGDWPGLEALAAYHRVSSLFLRGVANAGVRLPDQAVADALTRMRQRDAVRGLRQLAAMHRIIAALDAAGIPSLVLKGLPLGQRAYGDPFAKRSIDVDLLVPEDVVPAAADVLRTLGWRRVMPAFRETPLRRRWYDSVQKEDVFTGGGAKVELHRRLFGNRFLFNPSFDRVQAAAATVAIGTRCFRTLGDADQLLYLACHGALHFWYRLKWLCDFAA